MWLPTPVYERIPQFWLLLGLLFMSSGTYLGFDYTLSFVYFAVGFTCVAWSIVVFVKRARYRSDPKHRTIPTMAEEDGQNPNQSAESTEAPAGHAN